MPRTPEPVAATSAGSAGPTDRGRADAASPFIGYMPMDQFARSMPDPHRRRMSLSRIMNLLRRDPQFVLALFLAVPVALIETFEGHRPGEVALLAAGFLAVQVALTVRRPKARTTLMLALSAAFVVVSDWHGDELGVGLVGALMVPVVAMAAAIGTRGSMAIAALGFGSTLLPAGLPGLSMLDRLPSLAMASAEVVIALGSRSVVASLEQALERARLARNRDHRRARQIAAVEEVGRLLAREGPRQAVLSAIVELLETTFDFRYPSVYLSDGGVLRLGAQRNYATPIEVLDVSKGVLGRAARTLEPCFIPDVNADPDYLSADPAVKSEIALPLVNGGELLGLLSVESDQDRRLDRQDFATMQIVADRLAAALALGRERVKLAERADLLARLTGFSAGLASTQDAGDIYALIAEGARAVIVGHMVVVTLQDSGSGEYRIVAVAGGDPRMLGIRMLPGEGATGRAIADGQLIVDDHLERARFPSMAASADVPDVLAAVAVPLISGGGVIGAITWLRDDLAHPYSPEEQEVAALLGVQASLVLANHSLLQDARHAAITDPLTGLHNRRYFDASFEQLLALRARQGEGVRQPLSGIIFDLDHFGLVNKRHGHQVGDQVLRAFAEILGSRTRSSDLVARYGGEEFIVILPGASREQAARLADEIRVTFTAGRTRTPSGEMLACTVSAGCAALIDTELAGALLIEHADVALSMAKAAGRNQVVTA